MNIPSVSSKTKVWIAGIVAICALTALALVAFSANILRSQDTSAWARRFTKVIPVPAAHVRGKTLLYRDVLTRWDAVDLFLANAPASANTANRLATRSELHQEAYEQQIRELYMQAEAEQQHFVLPEEVVNQNMLALTQASSSTEPGDIDAFLQASFGWTADQFREWIIKPATLEEALARRAEVSGVDPSQWGREVATALTSMEVKRYLSFSTPYIPRVDSVSTSTAPTSDAWR